LVEPGHADLTIRRQCELLGLSRASLYYAAASESAENLRLMRLLDQEYTAHPFYGSRRMTAWLAGRGEAVNRKRVQRPLRVMGLEAIYPKPRLSAAGRSLGQVERGPHGASKVEGVAARIKSHWFGRTYSALS
jgi:putative transposase